MILWRPITVIHEYIQRVGSSAWNCPPKLYEDGKKDL